MLVVIKSAKSNLKRCYLELGGKSPNIIFNDDRGSYVFVVVDFDGEKIARKTPVLVGRSYEYQTEILSGLIGDEIIIDKGALEVMDGTYIKTK